MSESEYSHGFEDGKSNAALLMATSRRIYTSGGAYARGHTDGHNAHVDSVEGVSSHRSPNTQDEAHA